LACPWILVPHSSQPCKPHTACQASEGTLLLTKFLRMAPSAPTSSPYCSTLSMFLFFLIRVTQSSEICLLWQLLNEAVQWNDPWDSRDGNIQGFLTPTTVQTQTIHPFQRWLLGRALWKFTGRLCEFYEFIPTCTA
jgi:hypothetical protein